MKFLIIASLLLAVAYGDLIAFTGAWNVNSTDFNCNDLCCCPQGSVQITANPSNSSTVLITPTSWSNNAICTQLGRTKGSSATLPFPANIDTQSTPLSALYTDQNEGFSAAFFNVTLVVLKTKGVYLAIDDSNTGDIDGSICEVTMIKKVI